MSYCLKADIVGLGSEFSLPSGWTDAAITSLIAEITDDVNGLFNDDFSGVQTLTLTMDGSGSGIIQTRRYTKMPIVSISTITWRESTLSTFTVSNAWAVTDFVYAKYYIEATGAQTSIRYATRSKFIRGIRNYQIIGSFGHATVPIYVKYVTVLLCRERITPGYLAQMDLTSVAWSDYKATFSGNKKDIPTYTGYPIVDRIINKNVNKSLYIERV